MIRKTRSDKTGLTRKKVVTLRLTNEEYQELHQRSHRNLNSMEGYTRSLLFPEPVHLKMYVWEGVLSNYTNGLITVLASNIDEAIDVVRKQFEKNMEDTCRIIGTRIDGKPPTEYTQPKCVYVHGGSCPHQHFTTNDA